MHHANIPLSDDTFFSYTICIGGFNQRSADKGGFPSLQVCLLFFTLIILKQNLSVHAFSYATDCHHAEIFRSGVHVYQALEYLGHWLKKIFVVKCPIRHKEKAIGDLSWTIDSKEAEPILSHLPILLMEIYLSLHRFNSTPLLEVLHALLIGINSSSGKPQSLPTAVNLLSPPLLSQLFCIWIVCLHEC